MTAFVISRFVRHSIAAWLGVHYGRAVVGLWSRFSAQWGTRILIGLWTFMLVFAGIAIWRLIKTSRELEMETGKRLKQRVVRKRSAAA